MRMIEKIERSGRNVVIPVIHRTDGYLIMLEVSQSTILSVQNKYRREREKHTENGLEYAYGGIIGGDRDILWEVVQLLNPIVTGGTVLDVSDLRYRNHQLAEEVAEAIDEYVEEIYRLEKELSKA